MPHVMDDTEILADIASLPVCDEPPARALPPSRRGRPQKATGFSRLFTLLARLRPQKPHDVRGMPPFELPVDRLARQYPDLYLLSMAGAG